MKVIQMWRPFVVVTIDFHRKYERRSFTQCLICCNCSGNVKNKDSFCNTCGAKLTWPAYKTYVYNYNTDRYDEFMGDVTPEPETVTI